MKYLAFIFILASCAHTPQRDLLKGENPYSIVSNNIFIDYKYKINDIDIERRVYKNIERDSSARYFNQNIFYVNSLLVPDQDPYFGSNVTNSCLEKNKKNDLGKIVESNGSSFVFYKLHANNQKVLQPCDQEHFNYLVDLFLVYCSGERVFEIVKLFSSPQSSIPAIHPLEFCKWAR